MSNKWQYARDKECQQVQPAARDGLMERETHSRIYKIHISKYVHSIQKAHKIITVLLLSQSSEPAIAEYVTLPMTYERGKIRRPVSDSNVENRQNWTTVCGEKDTHCLSCDYF